MALTAKLIQRVSKTTVADVQHSSGYAATQNGSSFGTSSTETFAKRQAIEQNRKLVRGYNNARIARGVNKMPKAQTYQEMIDAHTKKAASQNQNQLANQQSNLSRRENLLARKDFSQIASTASTPTSRQSNVAAARGHSSFGLQGGSTAFGLGGSNSMTNRPTPSYSPNIKPHFG